jgi:hypothetical protein
VARIQEARDVSGFHSIDLRGIGTVTLVQGDSESLLIEAEENTMPEIESVVDGGVLRLGFKRHWGFSWRPGPISFAVTAREIRGLRVSGAGDIRANTLACGDLELRVSGSGSIAIDDLTATRMDFSVSGSGELTVLGTGDILRASISGSGKIRAERLACREVEAKISGSGDAFVSASESLDVRISGSGNVSYVGMPRMRTRTSGSGRIQQIDAG